MGLTKQRQSNWELMRIIAMLMIVCGHFVAQSDVRNYIDGVEMWCIDFLGLGFRIAVNLFLMLGCWFMVDTKFRAERVLKLALQIWFYSLAVVIVLLTMGYQLKLREIFSGLFPFSTTLWFATSYLVLLVLAPFLQRILLWEKAELKKFLVVQFAVISVVCTFHKLMDTYLCTIVWFSFIYLLIGYYKIHRYSKTMNVNKTIALGGGIYTLIVTIITFANQYQDVSFMSKIYGVLIRWMVDYKSVPNLFISFCIFIYFENLKIGYVKWINKIASSAFAVYLVHQGPGVQNVLWFDFYKCSYIFQNGYSPIAYVIFVTISCYILISIIEFIRRKYIEPIIMDSNAFLYIQNRLDNFFG